MGSITSWNRLEPRARSASLTAALEARIHDPLWLLVRQRQLGELRGEDAGSLVRADLRSETSLLSRPAPLECLVEREPADDDSPELRRAGEAGLHLLRLLGPQRATTYRAHLLEHFPLPAPDTPGLDDGVRRYLRLARRRIPNGAAIRNALQLGEPLEGILGTLNAGDETPAAEALTGWTQWYDGLISRPSANTWRSEQLEYSTAFAVTLPIEAPTLAIPPIGNPVRPPIGPPVRPPFDLPPGLLRVPRWEAQLRIDSYYGGSLDWPNLDLELSGGVAHVVAGTTGHRALPTPVRFRGMPAPRFWAFEDAAVDFGGIDTAPEDLGRLILAEFALIYGNDFFQVPLDLPVGSLTALKYVHLHTTFGETVEVKSAAELDQQAGGAHWRLFTLSGAPAGLPLLCMPHTGTASLDSRPIEEVLFARDEMANIAWAVERKVPSTGWRPFDRHEERPDAAPQQPEPPSGEVRYALFTPAPPFWVALVPGSGTRGEPETTRLYPRATAARGRIVADTVRVGGLTDEAIPREGLYVRRAYRLARWVDGSSYLWVGRRRQIGRGEAVSDLHFDALEDPKE